LSARNSLSVQIRSPATALLPCRAVYRIDG
jgi:hypothetical protein